MPCIAICHWQPEYDTYQIAFDASLPSILNIHSDLYHFSIVQEKRFQIINVLLGGRAFSHTVTSPGFLMHTIKLWNSYITNQLDFHDSCHQPGQDHSCPSGFRISLWILPTVNPTRICKGSTRRTSHYDQWLMCCRIFS